LTGPPTQPVGAGRGQPAKNGVDAVTDRRGLVVAILALCVDIWGTLQNSKPHKPGKHRKKR
jgi:hypothetical protein